jgi:hypothetical protein
LALGVTLIGAAVLIAANADRTVQGATVSSPAVFSTGFLVWSTCGVLGLLAGLIAARRTRMSPLRDEVASWDVAASVAPASPVPAGARFGAVLETVEGSA